MNRKILVNAILSFASLFSLPGYGNGVDLFVDETNRVSLTAQLQALGSMQKAQDFGVEHQWALSSNDSWLGLELSHQATPKLAAFALMQWQLDLFGESQKNDDNATFSVRQGAVGLKGDRIGQLGFGKQWSAIYDLLGSTDHLFISKPDASSVYQIDDGGASGSGRLDQGIVYRNSVGGFSLAAQYGGSSLASSALERSHNSGGMLSYRFDVGLTFGLSYGETALRTVEGEMPEWGIDSATKIKTKAFTVSYKGEKALICANVIDGDNAYITGFDGETSLYGEDALLASAKGGDLYARYQFSNRIVPYGYLSFLDFSEQQVGTAQIEGERIAYALGLLFEVTPVLSFGAEYHHHDFEQINSEPQKSAHSMGIQLQYQL